VEVGHVTYHLPDGRTLLDDVSFKVADGAMAALIGSNGAGKTTLLRLITGELVPHEGSVTRSGGLGVMPQFIGSHLPGQEQRTVRDLLLDVSPPAVRAAGREVDAAELALMETDDEPTQMRYAHALGEWSDVGGYDAEVLWDTVTVAALGQPYDKAAHRWLTELSGGECKRVALEALLRGREEVLLLDEPDNYLDVPGKRWLEQRLAQTTKTVLFVSHDRELLACTATALVTLEAAPGGSTVWVHSGPKGTVAWPSYAEVRTARNDRLAALAADWDAEHERLRQLVFRLRGQAAISPDLASRYHAMQTRLERFVAAGPPPAPPPEQNLTMRLGGGRTGLRVVTAQALELTGLTAPFDLEIFFGERVGVLGANGSGKSHLLRLLGGDERVRHSGVLKLGARVVPGLFAQTHEHPELTGVSLLDILTARSLDRGQAMGRLSRYGLHRQWDQRFETLSGGQQARLQVLLLELSGSTLLLLDEPTDNLDVDSAEALEEGLAAYEGTVVTVTHDRWFARSLDRFVVFGSDGTVSHSDVPSWDETRPTRR
jgi:ATPase subunit of ABC transporter with duplicated ATPase domains